MARIRSMKPEFWSDEELAAIPRDARLMYIGLWNLADEHGRLRGDPRYVKGQLFAYDDDLDARAVDILINYLAVYRKVIRYRVAGAAYLFLPNLAEHQRLEPDKVPSRLPAPEDADAEKSAPDADSSERRADESAQDADKSARGNDIDSTESESAPDLFTQIGADKSARDSDESAPRADESALARARLFSREQVAGSRLQVAGNARANARSTRAADDAAFDRFWTTYPRREAKPTARKAWDKAIKRADPEVIIAGAQRYRDQPGRDPKFTAHAATWLNGDRWGDELDPNAGRASPGGHRPYANPADPDAVYGAAL